MRNVLDSDDRGTLLLRCVRAYVKLDILASFELHTDQTIAFGRTVADEFLKLANVICYNIFSSLLLLTRSHEHQEYDPGGWNAPKIHLIQHLFDDIEAKGVTRNYSSKTFEKMHGPVKDSYKRRTNFKNVGGQVSGFVGPFTPG